MQHGVALANMVALSSFTFFGIMHREILMDMNDEAGDRAAGVLTLPVVFGASLTGNAWHKNVGTTSHIVSSCVWQ